MFNIICRYYRDYSTRTYHAHCIDNFATRDNFFVYRSHLLIKGFIHVILYIWTCVSNLICSLLDRNTEDFFYFHRLFN